MTLETRRNAGSESAGYAGNKILVLGRLTMAVAAGGIAEHIAGQGLRSSPFWDDSTARKGMVGAKQRPRWRRTGDVLERRLASDTIPIIRSCIADLRYTRLHVGIWQTTSPSSRSSSSSRSISSRRQPPSSQADVNIRSPSHLLPRRAFVCSGQALHRCRARCG